MILSGQNSIIFYLSFFTWYDYRVTYLKIVIVIFRAENREIFLLISNYTKNNFFKTKNLVRSIDHN
jgi:hypothetical protein